MSNIETRIKAIENRIQPDRPLAVIYQDIDNPEIYHYGERVLSENDLANLDDDHIWLIVVYDREGENPDDDNSDFIENI